MEDDVKTLDERIYDMHGLVQSTASDVRNLSDDLKDHIRWAEGFVLEAKKDEKIILGKIGSFERRMDKIELKVAAGVAVFMFSLNHIGWVFDNVKKVAYIVTSVAKAMGN